MKIPNRDDRHAQGGQAIVEYILVLTVTVGLVLGAVYQLNGAFKVWAENYFGNYIACLLETGELPTIDGTPGDSGICNQQFKAFSLADGRPKALTNGSDSGTASANSGNTRDGGSGSASSDTGGTREGRSGSSGSGSTNYLPSRFGAGGSKGSGGTSKRGRGRGAGEEANTGSTEISSVGGYRGNGRVGVKERERLNNQFAFEQEREARQSRKVASSTKPGGETVVGKDALRLKAAKKKAVALEEDSGFTIGDFLRWLIIFAILLALVLFIGGQMLQVSNSME